MTKITFSNRLIDVKTGKWSENNPDNRVVSERPEEQPRTSSLQFDTVDLSDDAKTLINGERLAPHPLDQSTLDRMKTIPDQQEWANKVSDYMRKRADLVRNTLNIPDNVSIMSGGVANTVFDKIAEAHGLTKPEMPQSLKDIGEKNILSDEDDRTAQAGVVGLSYTNVDDPRFGQHMEIAFNRSASVPPEKQTLVALKGGQDASSSLLATIKSSPLGRYTDARQEDGASLFAITDGQTGPQAKVAASIRSVGMDDQVNRSALDLLKTIKRYLPH